MSTTEVLVQEEFISGVNDLVIRYTAEKPSVLTNYMIWRVLAAFYPDRPPDAQARL